MRWGREVDYHGSRSYGSDDGSEGLSGLKMAWLIEMVKIKLGTLRRRPAAPATLLNENQRSFSLLGTSSATRPAECPFPPKPPIRAHDWRVLP